jgi:hypothetical protein
MEYLSAFFQFLKMLLFAPVVLPWIWVFIAAASLIGMGLIPAGLFSAVHARYTEGWRELLVTTTRVRVAWICGWAFTTLVILLWVATLMYLDRILSFRAALPHLFAAAATLSIAAALRSKVRSKVRTVQKLVQGGRA